MEVLVILGWVPLGCADDGAAKDAQPQFTAREDGTRRFCWRDEGGVDTRVDDEKVLMFGLLLMCCIYLSVCVQSNIPTPTRRVYKDHGFQLVISEAY